jgi:hypothetical protein
METNRSAPIIAALSALAQEHRLAAFRALVQAGPEGMAAGAIAESSACPTARSPFTSPSCAMPGWSASGARGGA